jgi:hypothetical protein
MNPCSICTAEWSPKLFDHSLIYEKQKLGVLIRWQRKDLELNKNISKISAHKIFKNIHKCFRYIYPGWVSYLFKLLQVSKLFTNTPMLLTLQAVCILCYRIQLGPLFYRSYVFLSFIHCPF